MRKICNKGHRIRASDKQLVYHFSIGTLLFVFVAVLLLLNTKQLMRTDCCLHVVLYYHNIILLVPYSWVIMFDLWKSFSRGFCSCFVYIFI